MFDVHQAIGDAHGERDEARAQKYVEGLMEEFAQSPEGRAILETGEDLGWASMMMDYAINYIGCTPPEMRVRDFDEVLFELFPRKVSVEADRAGEIITELRAFWSFLARQYGLDNARAILANIDDSAASRLQKELDDPTKFGMAKSFFMLGQQAGFDMTTPEGLAAFQTIYNAKLLSGQLAPQLDHQQAELDVPSLGPERVSGEALKKKRKEKRRQREAKKRNRPR